jgi:hypothetical protein
MESVNNSELNEWKEAVINACIIDCLDWYGNDPGRTIRELCQWEQILALDPRVSSDAQKLIDDTIEKCIEEISSLLSSWSNLRHDDMQCIKDYFSRNLREMKGKHHGIGCKGL